MILQESMRYKDGNVIIDEHVIEIDAEEQAIWFMSELDDSETTVLVQFLSDERPQVLADMPIEEVHADGASAAWGRMFRGSMRVGTRALIKLSTKGYAKVRILIAQVRRAVATGFAKLPCKACKLVVKTIISSVLWQLGVPALPNGDFDLTHFAATLQNVGADILAGKFGTVAEQLLALLPTGAWAVVMNVLAGLNWLFDMSDRVNEKVCQQLKLCP